MERNCVLICLDTVRKDFFDEHASRLGALTDVSFEQCRAASSWSTPSHGSMFTGQLPHETDIHSYDHDFSKLSLSATFLGNLTNHHTVGISANTFASGVYGFDTLFDDFYETGMQSRFPDGMSIRKFRHEEHDVPMYRAFLRECFKHDRTLKSLANGLTYKLDRMANDGQLPKLFDNGTSAALSTAERVVTKTDRPSFVFMNLMEAHNPHQHLRGYDADKHDVPDGWSSQETMGWARDPWELEERSLDGMDEHFENFRQLYATGIDYMDRKVGAFARNLAAKTDRETTIIVTADHGENLGFPEDGGLFNHKSSLSEGLLHVPLAVINPPEGYPERVTDYVSHLELGRLVTGLAHGETPDVTDDRIVAELVGCGSANERYQSGEMDTEEFRYWDRMLRCAYEGERKVVWDSLDDVETYEIDHERPCWQALVEDEESVPAWADDRFETEIKTYKSQWTPTDRTVSDEARDSLEHLGYL